MTETVDAVNVYVLMSIANPQRPELRMTKKNKKTYRRHRKSKGEREIVQSAIE